jgi:glycosyltransferase involved in cell wall biosynthesis
MNKKDLKIALVHDFLNQYGGAERVLEVLVEMFPSSPIYTLLYDKEKMRGKFEGREIHASFLQKLPKFIKRRPKWLLPIFPVAPETFDLREFDLVISSSGAWTKGIITRLNTTHIAYIHSPMRFAWDANGEYIHQQKKCFLINFIVRRILNYVRIWDKVAADRPDWLIANSEYTRSRINKYYGRDSVVIYPPVETKYQVSSIKYQENANDKAAKYFLIVSRLSAYKKINAVIEAFNKLELLLVIVGEGKQEKYLRSIANKNIRFLGWQPDEKIEKIYANAKAFLFAGVDDFGIAPVEAMNFGVPVLAIRKGGVREIVEEGKTGEFFDAAVPEVIADCVRRFMENEEKYDREYIITKSREFSKERFIRDIKEYIDKAVNNLQ